MPQGNLKMSQRFAFPAIEAIQNPPPASLLVLVSLVSGVIRRQPINAAHAMMLVEE